MRLPMYSLFMVAVSGQDAVPGKAVRAGAGGKPPRPRGEEAGGRSRKLSLHPTPEVVRSPGREGRPEGARRSRESSGKAGEKCRWCAGRRTTQRGTFPSVRNPSERAGVSRFSAAALAPPLNKIDLKKNGAEKKKRLSHVVTAPTHPAGEDPRRRRASQPSKSAKPNNLSSWREGSFNSPPEKSGTVGAESSKLYSPPRLLLKPGP